jgi:hypothetical protein
MTPARQAKIGIIVLALALVAVWLQVSQHHEIYSLIAIFLGAVGGQQLGQAHARSKNSNA